MSRGRHKRTGAVRAIKTMSKSLVKNLERFKQEIAIMKLMDHPNIVKLFETFEDRTHIYLVMEFCCGGDMFERILEAVRFTEVNAATVVQQILRAVFYMHENCVVHRDLKPENFLFLSKEPISTSTLKVIDFGLSSRFEPGRQMSTKAGTPYYVAPQVLTGKYDSSCDLWSVGVITYTLLCGYPPFYGKTDHEVLAKVRSGNYSFAGKEWVNISEEAKALVRGLIRMAPKERLTAEQALNHDWIRLRTKSQDVCLQNGFLENLWGFRSQNRLKKAALHIISSQISEVQTKNLREMFVSLDSNSDGLITLEELREGLQKAGIVELPADLQDIVDGVDVDGSGVIDYTEFLAANLERTSYLQDSLCRQAFTVFDLDGDGKISLEELKKVLDSGVVQEEQAVTGFTSAELIKDVDKNGDGHIDFEEFMEMMRSRSKPKADERGRCALRLENSLPCKVSGGELLIEVAKVVSLGETTPKDKEETPTHVPRLMRSAASVNSILGGDRSEGASPAMLRSTTARFGA